MVPLRQQKHLHPYNSQLNSLKSFFGCILFGFKQQFVQTQASSFPIVHRALGLPQQDRKEVSSSRAVKLSSFVLTEKRKQRSQLNNAVCQQTQQAQIKTRQAAILILRSHLIFRAEWRIFPVKYVSIFKFSPF